MLGFRSRRRKRSDCNVKNRMRRLRKEYPGQARLPGAADCACNHAPRRHNDSPPGVRCTCWACGASPNARPHSPASSVWGAAWRNRQAWTASRISGPRSAPHTTPGRWRARSRYCSTLPSCAHTGRTWRRIRARLRLERSRTASRIDLRIHVRDRPVRIEQHRDRTNTAGGD